MKLLKKGLRRVKKKNGGGGFVMYLLEKAMSGPGQLESKKLYSLYSYMNSSVLSMTESVDL